MDRKKILLYEVLTALAIVLFVSANIHATEQRGYAAVGGEGLLLLLPVCVHAIGSCMVGMGQALRSNDKAGRGGKAE